MSKIKYGLYKRAFRAHFVRIYLYQSITFNIDLIRLFHLFIFLEFASEQSQLILLQQGSPNRIEKEYDLVKEKELSICQI